MVLTTVRVQGYANGIAEAPLDLAKMICGFKHDEEWPEALSFFELRRARTASASKESGAKGSGLLQRLFRRR